MTRTNITWIIVGTLLVAVVGLGLRVGTNVRAQDTVRDEYLMRRPIDTIVQQGWSVETVINYQEVKGPVFFAIYAALGGPMGGEMNDFRLVSIVFFVLGVVPILLIGTRCGVRGPPLLGLAALYALMPYNAFLGQLLFSEPTFIAIGSWMMFAVVWGCGDDDHMPHRIAGPIVFGILLSILLHHRPHAVALAGAAALATFERDGFRSWRWWLACFIAGLSRMPLWLHWGGLVTSDYQGLFGFGVRLDGLTYLLAALLPATGMFVLAALTMPNHRVRRWWVLAGGAAGLLVGLIAQPDLASRVQYTLPATGEPKEQIEYAGVVGTMIKAMAPEGVVRSGILIAMAAAGGAALASLRVMAAGEPRGSAASLVGRLAFWMLACGVPLYVITAGPVYDRYLAVWIILLPVLWWRALPTWLRLVQTTMLAGMLAYFVRAWLM